MRKRLCGLALSILLLCGPSARASPFTDISGSNYAAGIEWVYDQGITIGTTATTFAPYVDCSRIQILTFMWRASGRIEYDNGTYPFDDDPPTNKDFLKAAYWAYYSGIEPGIKDDDKPGQNLLKPSEPCPREDVVMYFWRLDGAKEPEDSSLVDQFTDIIFTDQNEELRYAVSWALERGITGGFKDNTFRPGKPCQRGQIATFLHRYYVPEVALT